MANAANKKSEAGLFQLEIQQPEELYYVELEDIVVNTVFAVAIKARWIDLIYACMKDGASIEILSDDLLVELGKLLPCYQKTIASELMARKHEDGSEPRWTFRKIKAPFLPLVTSTVTGLYKKQIIVNVEASGRRSVSAYSSAKKPTELKEDELYDLLKSQLQLKVPKLRR